MSEGVQLVNKVSYTYLNWDSLKFWLSVKELIKSRLQEFFYDGKPLIQMSQGHPE